MGTIWELDFYSRPLLDENKKKLWEVLICESPSSIDRDPDSLFKYSQLCSSTTVNSIWLREAIEEAISKAETSPKQIRFFRRQMNNMITKACEDAGIKANPSRRTYALERWLASRMKDDYPNRPEYDPKAVLSSSVQYPPMNPINLPDAVKGDKGDKWAFVSLEAAAFADLNQWEISFGEAFPLSMFDVKPDTKIPGLIFFSPRSLPLAGWMSGLEMGFLQFEGGLRPKMRLETGASDSWILANLTNPQTLAEAKGFEAAKEKANGVHFLAVQSSPESESFAGFWLLLAQKSLPKA
ncbi:MAG: Tab2/Atab2 family RNA-binding protein [Prochloraceae cyanobacterium]